MGYLHQIPHLRAEGTLYNRRQKKKHKSQRGWKTPRNRDPLSQQDPHKYELTETAYTGPAQKWLHALIPNPEAIYN